MAEDKGKITFGFSKKFDKRPLADSVIRDEGTKDVAKDEDFVLSISGKKLKSAIPDESDTKKELVIPLIAKNNWRVPNTAPGSNVKIGRDTDDLESQAVRELLDEARKNSDENHETTRKESSMVIPVYMQNRIPEGYETDDRLDVALRAEESTLDDYDSVPIEDFGLAMLRGMGWKPGHGIGAKNKRVVTPCEVVLRPKGLGLGANPRLKINPKAVAKEKDKESKALIVGACVKLLSGANKGLYGEVQGLDFDNARVMVKLKLSGENVTISELYVEVVSKDEFKKEGKLINKAKYDEYKAKEDLKNSSGRLDESRESKYKSDSRHSDSQKGNSTDSESGHHKRKHSPANKHSSKHAKNDHKTEKKLLQPISWVHPLLRVRFIDKRYKNGQFYNSKIIIDDVVNRDLCICRTEKGRLLEDIPQEWLETLIPKTTPAIVMIVQGANKGQLGEIIDKNKKKCEATIQMLQDKNLVQLDYDSICEYAGKIPEDY